MNRRQFLGSVVGATASGVVLADCRDDNRIMRPDGESSECVNLTIRNAVTSDNKTARAVFHFGAYEDLLAHQSAKKTYTFMFENRAHRIRVTHLSVEPMAELGCVVCDVRGRVWSSG